MSHVRTGLLMAALTVLFVVVGLMIAGHQGMVIAFLMATAMNFGAYWFSDRIVLRMHGAQEASESTAPQFFRIVRELAQRANMPMPRVYLMDNDQPNAFATGRNPANAAVAATTGLLRMLDASEVRAVMAHELAHVRNRDTLTMAITATIAGAIGMLANFGMMFRGQDGRPNPLGVVGTILAMIVAPLAATLVQMAISRSREYEADRIGAEISGDPRALASALDKISRGAEAIPNPSAEANPASAHLFIMNPLGGSGMDNLFSTHPSATNRIARLLEMAGSSPGGGFRSQATRGSAASAAGTHGAPRRRTPWS